MGLAFANCRIAQNRIFPAIIDCIIRKGYRGKPKNFLLDTVINWITGVSDGVISR